MKERLLSDDRAWEFAEGTWTHAFEIFGAHREGDGFRFTLWAPGARSVRLTGSWCDWDPNRHFMETTGDRGVWTLFLPGLEAGVSYKYVVETQRGELLYKADPYGFGSECPPETASRVMEPDAFRWTDGKWMENRKKGRHMEKPLNIYEVHLGSWRRHEDGSLLSYRELAETLVPYAVDMGYTHLELMPVMEHPFDGSWGYQCTGYYAPTSRYGEPQDFQYFMNEAHRAGLGVILDWAPAHFCRDAHGLGNFVGEPLYDGGSHPQWGTYKFDVKRGEVRSFLISNAIFWLEYYHADGIRVDGVTSMLYLNFGIDDERLKKHAADGSEHDYDSIALVQRINTTVSREYPDVMMIAEESTAWPLVTYPPDQGGLGFHYKWDMGWMHDTLNYMKTDFPYRPAHHGGLTFSMMYAFNENFILALSHDEVVHGKASLIGRMPGDYWRQFAGLRVLALYQMAHSGAKHNFMGAEIAQFIEWRYYEGLEWFLLDYDAHRKHQQYIKELNHLFLREKAFWQMNYSWDGFEWLDADDAKQSILTFIRHGKKPTEDLVCLLAMVPEVYEEYRVGVPRKGTYVEIFNSDDQRFGGSGRINPEPMEAEKIPMHGKKYSVVVRTPPIGGLVLKRLPAKKEDK